VTYSTWNFSPTRRDWSGSSEYLLKGSAYGGESDAVAIAAFCAMLGHPAALDFQTELVDSSICYGFEGEEWQLDGWCEGKARRQMIISVTCAIVPSREGSFPVAAPEAAVDAPQLPPVMDLRTSVTSFWYPGPLLAAGCLLLAAAAVCAGRRRMPAVAPPASPRWDVEGPRTPRDSPRLRDPGAKAQLEKQA